MSEKTGDPAVDDDNKNATLPAPEMQEQDVQDPLPEAAFKTADSEAEGEDFGGLASPASSEDRKPAAATVTHPYDQIEVFDFDISEPQSRRGGTLGEDVSRTHHHSDQFEMSMALQYGVGSPPAAFAAASSPAAAAYPPPNYMLDPHVGASPSYEFMQHSSPQASMSRHPGSPSNFRLPYERMMHQQPMPSVAYGYPAAAAAAPPRYDPSAPQLEAQQLQPRTSTGEHSQEFPRGPSQEELDAARTARARHALTTWYQRLEDLYRYKLENGHCNVPQKYESNRELGIWVNKQRMEKKAYDENRKSSMTAKKIAALNRIGFQWAKRKGQAAWMEKYHELREYKRIHGNCEVPTKYAANPALGRWVSTQRSNYKDFMENNDNSRMTASKVRMLENLGFRWRMMQN